MKDLVIELLDFYQKTIPNEKSLSYKESIINGSYHLNMLFIIQDIILDLNEAKEVNLNERIIYVLNQLLEKTKRNFCVYDIANLLYRLNISTEYSNNFLEMKALVTELLEIYNIGENQKSHSYRENMFNVRRIRIISAIT